MSNFLKNNQKTEVRARISNDIVLYEPSEEQITKLKEFNSKIDEFTEKLEPLKPTAEAMNVSKAEETVPATTE